MEVFRNFIKKYKQVQGSGYRIQGLQIQDSRHPAPCTLNPVPKYL